MADYKCAGCGREIHNYTDDWSCRVCGCITAEKARAPKESAMTTSTVELLPLPEDAVEWLRQYGVANTAFQMEVIEGWFQAHARAVAEHNVRNLTHELANAECAIDAEQADRKKAEAEIEALRAEVLRIADEMRARMVGNISHHPKPVYGGELLDWANALEAALAAQQGGGTDE